MAKIITILIFFIIFNTIINNETTSISKLETEQKINCGVFWDGFGYKATHQSCGSSEATPNSSYLSEARFRDSNVFLITYSSWGYKGEVNIFSSSNPETKVSLGRSVSYHMVDISNRGTNTDWGTPPHGCVRFYQYCNYSWEGQYKEFCVTGGNFELTQNVSYDSFFSNQILSIKVARFTSVYLDSVRNISNSVARITVDKNVECLVKERLDLVAYYRNIQQVMVKKFEKPDEGHISQGQAVIYERENYYGERKITIRNDVENFYPPWPVRSIRVAENTIAVLNDQTQYQGNTYAFKKSTPFISGITVKSVRTAFLNPSQSQDMRIPSEGFIFLYEYCGFRGRWIELNSTNKANVSTLDFRPQSIKAGKWTILELYRNSNFGGTMAYINARNVDCMAEDGTIQVKELWNNAWSSKVKVEDHSDDSTINAGCARIYTGREYFGKYFELCATSNENLNTREWRSGSNEPIFYGQSVRLASNVSVVLYNNQFSSFTFTENTPSFDSNLHEKIKIMRVENLNNNMSTISAPQGLTNGCIAVYSNASFKGKEKLFCSDQADILEFNLNVGSMRIGWYTSVEFYLSTNYNTYLRSLTNESFNLLPINSSTNTAHKSFYRSFSSFKLKKLDYPDQTQPNEGQVFFYSLWNFMRGKRLDLSDINGVTIFNTRFLKFEKNEDFYLESFKLGKNTRLIVYSGDEIFSVSTNETMNTSSNKYLTELSKSKKVFNFRIELIKYPLSDDKIDPEGNCIKIYQHCGFQGERKEICTSKEYFEWFQLYPGSIKVGKNVKVTLHLGDRYFGAGREISNTSECLFQEKSDLRFYYKMVRSIKLEIINEKNWEIDNGNPPDGCAYFYKGCEFRGPRLELCGNAQGFPTVTKDNINYTYDNDISSLKVGVNTAVTLYDLRSYQGGSIVFVQDKRCLLDDVDKNIPKWHNLASSTKVARIVPPKCALLFQYPDFREKPTQICPDDKDYVVKGELINYVRSILLGEGAKLQIFTNSNAIDIITVTKDTPKLDVITFLTGYKGSILITALP